jgi:hypothetical protein
LFTSQKIPSYFIEPRDQILCRRDHPFKTSAFPRGEGCLPLPTFADSRGVGVAGMPTSAIFFLNCFLSFKKYSISSANCNFYLFLIIAVHSKDRACSLFFCPRTRPKTFLQCFALYFLCSKAKHCRNVLGRVLGRKNKLHAPSLRLSQN